MKHKIVLGLLMITAATTAVFGLAACQKKKPVPEPTPEPPAPPAHEHSYSTDWTSDDDFHWHASTCGHEDAVSGRAAHTYENGVCSECLHAHENHTFEGTACSVCGYTLPTSKLQYEEVFGDDGETVTGYSVVGWDESETDRTNLVIPAEYNGKPVVSVGNEAFHVEEGDDTLTAVFLPETVKDLGEYCFYACSAVVSINLECIEVLQKGALRECTALESVELGFLKSVGKYPFYGCTSLKFVRIEGAENFETEFLRNCPALERAEFGDNVQSLPRNTFYDSGAVRELSLGKAFSQEVTSDTFPAGLESIEVSTENVVYSTEGGILYNKDKTQLVYVPKYLKGRVVIADGVKKLDYGYFYFWDHPFLTSITIPASVERIENGPIEQTFRDSNRIAEIYNLSQVELVDLEDHFGLAETTVIHKSLSEKSVVTDLDKDGFVWRTDADALHAYLGRETQLTLPDGHEGKSYAVGSYAFYGSALEKVIIPANITALGEYSFGNCRSLSEVVIAEGIREIGLAAFNSCEMLSKLSLPKSIKTVGAGAFYGCNAIERVDYAGTVSEWAAIEFGNNYSNIFKTPLRQMPAALYLGDGSPLPETIVIEGIEKVGANAFNGAPVKMVILGKGVKTVGQNAFINCEDLKQVVIGKDTTYFAHAFAQPLETFFYEGDKETWATLNDGSGGGSAYRNAAVYFFSDGTPSDEQWEQSPNWWHYDTDGSVIIWFKG